MNRRDLQQLSQLRLEEAQALLKAAFPAGAYYLAGYSIECALKACIARSVQQYDFPDKNRVNQSYVHDIVQLLKTAGLEGALAGDMESDPSLASNWAKVKDWNEAKRYDHAISLTDAEEMLEAVSHLTNGALQWLTRHW